MRPIVLPLTLLLLVPLKAFSLAIIGADDRKQVLSPETEPFYRSVGILQDSDKPSFCTATLISPRHIITNGHCVVLFKQFPTPVVRYQALTFTPGKLNQTSAPFGTYKITKIETFNVWMEKGNADYDVAVLELDRPTTLPAVKLVSFADPYVLQRQKITVTGYSGGKAYGTLWTGSGTIESVFESGQSFTHNVDTAGGTSGSLARLKYKNEWVAVGIHRGSQFDGKGTEKNRGVIFNKTVIQAIKNWIQK